MKLLISRPQLLSLTSKMQNVVSAKPVIPIAGNLLLEAIADELVLTATDLTLSMRTFMKAEIAEEGAITLPAKRFFQLVREITTPQMQITTIAPEVIQIDAGSAHFKIQGINRREFPEFPQVVSSARFSMSPNELRSHLTRTLFVAARDETRQNIGGVQVTLEGGTMLFTATDGKRISRIRTEISYVPVSSEEYILPVKCIDELLHLLDPAEKEVTLSFLGNQMAADCGNAQLVSQLIPGPYPDFTRFIPQKQQDPVPLHREELMTLLRQVALFSGEETNAVRLSFSPGSLHLSAANSKLGEGQVNMPVNWTGEKLDVSYNPHHFLDFLRHSKDEVVQFSLNHSFDPGLITDSTSAEFVIMPMRME